MPRPTKRSLLAASALVLLPLTLTACSGDTAAPPTAKAPVKVGGGTAAVDATAPAAPAEGTLNLPQADQLGQGWTQTEASPALVGLFGACEAPTATADGPRNVAEYTTPNGWTILVETVNHGKDATAFVQAVETDLSTCQNDGRTAFTSGGAYVSRVPAIQGQRSAGVHTVAATETGQAVQSGWLLPVGNSSIAVLAKAPYAMDVIGGPSDEFAAQVALAALAAAKGDPYGPLTAPDDPAALPAPVEGVPGAPVPGSGNAAPLPVTPDMNGSPGSAGSPGGLPGAGSVLEQDDDLPGEHGSTSEQGYFLPDDGEA